MFFAEFFLIIDCCCCIPPPPPYRRGDLQRVSNAASDQRSLLWGRGSSLRSHSSDCVYVLDFFGRQSAVTVTAAIARSGGCRRRKRVCAEKKKKNARGTALVMVAANCREVEGGHSVHCSRSSNGYGSAALSCRWFLAAGRHSKGSGSGRVWRLVPVGVV
ncbi:hypothetical protein NDU88_007465 [Pleurodeles waltl]|uniref:Secreted protein n=1 Tax=Pleurodeles waltl TaxID=8319 RepID=A0AAV7RQ71_PLEWA|nr:hypothetical protein NDU88_007465 [Pleurodeles waltl]